MNNNLLEFNNIYGKTFQEKLITLNKCNCCERHSINKPLIFSPWIETTWNIKTNNYTCMCSCRHYARKICRQHENYNKNQQSINDSTSNYIFQKREKEFINKLKQRDIEYIKKHSK